MIDWVNVYIATGYKHTKLFLIKIFPDLLAAAAILVAGIVVARLTTWMIRRVISWLSNASYKTKQRGMAAFASHFAYWAIVITAAYFALLKLDIKFISDWLNTLAGFTPKLIITLVIIFIGYVISRVVRTALIEISPSPLTRISADFIALFIVAVTILIAVDQIDINTYLLNILFVIAFTLLLTSIFGVMFLSSYQLVREMLQARFVAETYIIGQHISVAGFEGTIESIKRTSVHLIHDTKIIILPAHVLLDHPVVIINDVEGDL